GKIMIHTELAFLFPEAQARPTLGGRDLTDADSSPTSATPEQQRLAGIRKMHRHVVAPRAHFDQPKYADLRDGGLMPRKPVDRSMVYFWIITLIFAIACWTYALPKIVRAVADAIVIGANPYH